VAADRMAVIESSDKHNGSYLTRGQPGTTVKRVFYVLYLPEIEASRYIDAIRFLANPEEKWRAHITVRGPYRRQINTAKLNERLAGNRIAVEGVGRFRNNGQQTVFLHCSGTHLKDVWHKGDYPYNPHLTIYDGPSREIAGSLEAILDRYCIRIECLCDRLEPMVSVRGVLRMDLGLHVAAHLFGPQHTGGIGSLQELASASVVDRLGHIERLCRRLAGVDIEQMHFPSMPVNDSFGPQSRLVSGL